VFEYLEQELNLKKQRLSNEQQKMKIQAKKLNIKMKVAQKNLGFKLNNQAKKQKQASNFQRILNEYVYISMVRFKIRNFGFKQRSIISRWI
jgi:hypothetical protein